MTKTEAVLKAEYNELVDQVNDGDFSMETERRIDAVADELAVIRYGTSTGETKTEFLARRRVELQAAAHATTTTVRLRVHGC